MTSSEKTSPIFRNASIERHGWRQEGGCPPPHEGGGGRVTSWRQDPCLSDKALLKERAGFTLIEVLIAMAIFSFIALGTSEAIRRGFNVKKVVEEQWNAIHGIRSALVIMQRDIHLAFHKSLDSDDSFDFGSRADEMWFKGFFIGKSEALHFTSLSHRKLYENVHESELNEVGYQLSADPEKPGKNRLLRRSSVIVDQDRERGGEEDLLLEDIKEVQFRYFSKERDLWFDEWDTERLDFKNKFPDAIEIKLIVFEKKGGKEETVEYASKVLIALPNNKPEESLEKFPEPKEPKEEPEKEPKKEPGKDGDEE
jgi:general secretion pathway protein J